VSNGERSGNEEGKIVRQQLAWVFCFDVRSFSSVEERSFLEKAVMAVIFNATQQFSFGQNPSGCYALK
jgi:hypothetical protein